MTPEDLSSTDLAPIVAQALGSADLTILEWRMDALGAGGSKAVGTSDGVYRISGTGRNPSRTLS